MLQMPDAEEGNEPWFQLAYVSATLPQSLLSEWATAQPAPELALPMRNEFIASDFALVADQAEPVVPQQAGHMANGTSIAANGHASQVASVSTYWSF